MLSRPVAGLACKIRLSIRQYQAIALVARDEGHVIRLMHRDPGLSIDLTEMDDFEAAEEYRDRLAGFLDLPPLMLAGTAAAEGAAVGTARSTRRHRPALMRRPRFLARRRKGEVISIRKLDGREIIART